MTIIQSAAVVIVDDDRGFADALALLLGKHGYQSSVGYSGYDGNRLLSTVDAKVAIIDVHLPGVDGLELTDLLRHRARPPAVILISADDSAETEQRCRRSAAIEFLVKPIAPRRLLQLVEHQIGVHC